MRGRNAVTDQKIILRQTLRSLLADKRLTIKAVAEATGIPRTTLGDWISAGNIPRNLSQVRKLARYLGVSIEYLLFGEGGPDLGGSEAVILDGIFRVRLERINTGAAENEKI
jgi:transcriptional regulator with XRE-family HTH domain